MRTEDIKPIKVGRTEDAETCDAIEVHSDLLKIVNTTLPEETELYDLAELFKVFGDSTRKEYCLYCLKQRYVYVILQLH